MKSTVIKKVSRHIGVLIVLIFLGIHLFTINDYGFTWDFHFHFFGGGKLLGIEPTELEPRNLPFVDPDPRLAWTLPYGPIMSIPPVASYLLFNTLLHLMPPDSAYHLPIILWGVLGIGILYIFMKQAYSPRIAFFSALFLALTPRYFGDLHNNMKDIPSAVSFALNMWLLWRLVTYKRPIDLLWAALGFALAFSIKINSIFIPLVYACWLIFLHRTHKKTVSMKQAIWYILAAPIAALVLWSVFWAHPLEKLSSLVHFTFSTNNIEVLLRGSWYCSGLTVPWYYPYWYLGTTTPLLILLFFIVGLVSRQKKSLLLLWLIVPLTRYFLPSVGVIDGVRHFEEALFPIAAIAALGIDYILSFIRGRLSKLILSTLALCYLFIAIYQYHPYQITYFNELVGGAKGAWGNYDLDYWGTSQKAAVEWVNAHAPQNARVHIVMSAAVAAQYLRPDLLPNLNAYGYDESDFVILLNRQSFFYRFFYAYEYLLHHAPAHTISVQGAPLTWIYDNRTDNNTPRQTPWWNGEDPCIIKYWRGQRP